MNLATARRELIFSDGNWLFHDAEGLMIWQRSRHFDPLCVWLQLYSVNFNLFVGIEGNKLKRQSM